MQNGNKINIRRPVQGVKKLHLNLSDDQDGEVNVLNNEFAQENSNNHKCLSNYKSLKFMTEYVQDNSNNLRH